MNLKNYSSSVPVDRSIQLIEYQLVTAGAQHISKSYADQQVTGIVFELIVKEQSLVFKLPARWDRVFAKMLSERNKSSRQPIKPEAEDNLKKQAQRTAWKILLDKVQIQVTNILIDQEDPVEAFMSYLYDGRTDRTAYEIMKETNYRGLLGEGKK